MRQRTDINFVAFVAHGGYLLTCHVRNVYGLYFFDCGNVEHIVNRIWKKHGLPDIVFLDVELSDGTGFDLLQRLKPIDFKVIFITGYNDFAIKAFRFSAIDYLVKPLDPQELTEAVQKAETALGKELFDLKINNLFANLERPKDLQKLLLKTADRIYSINVQDITNCESDKNYTTFYFISSPKIVVSTTLKEFELLLSPYIFFRSHQSHLINMAYFDHFIKVDGGNKIVLKNKQTIPLSVRKKEEFLTMLQIL